MKIKNVVILGGAGHIGLPMGLQMASEGHNVLALDINHEAVESLNSGKMPFLEAGAEELLVKVLQKGLFRATEDFEVISKADIIIICIGTPLDNHLSPVPRIFEDLIMSIKPYLQSKQLLMLRSTVYPGTTRLVENLLQDIKVAVAFCPERILQGHALEELKTLPTIISGVDERSVSLAESFFSEFSEVAIGSIEEAELAKLFLNTYRYIEFATTNQLYMIANEAGIDYSNVMKLMKSGYPRAQKLAGPGFAAGPCLMKDTMQLVAFSQNNFSLGSSAFLVNEGLVLYVVKMLEKKYKLRGLKVGLLGMAFKAENDDIRSSLSYRMKKALFLAGAIVSAADRFVKVDQTLIEEQILIKENDIIIICTPHNHYKNFEFKNKEVIDIWNLLGNGNLIGYDFSR
jgi:UDP-N-acetyl-D-mannosaminuronic acid dehydrogenase